MFAEVRTMDRNIYYLLLLVIVCVLGGFSTLLVHDVFHETRCLKKSSEGFSSSRIHHQASQELPYEQR